MSVEAERFVDRILALVRGGDFRDEAHFCKVAGVTPNTLSLWKARAKETKRRQFVGEPETHILVARALQLTLEELYGFPPPKLETARDKATQAARLIGIPEEVIRRAQALPIDDRSARAWLRQIEALLDS